jgi:hypothetical protein
MVSTSGYGMADYQASDPDPEVEDPNMDIEATAKAFPTEAEDAKPLVLIVSDDIYAKVGDGTPVTLTVQNIKGAKAIAFAISTDDQGSVSALEDEADKKHEKFPSVEDDDHQEHTAVAQYYVVKTIGDTYLGHHATDNKPSKSFSESEMNFLLLAITPKIASFDSPSAPPAGVVHVYGSDNGTEYPVVRLERKVETDAIYADEQCQVQLPSGVSVHVVPTIVDDPMRSGDGACGSKRLRLVTIVYCAFDSSLANIALHSSSWSSPRRQQKKLVVKPLLLPDVYTGSASMPGMGGSASYSSSSDDDD